MATTLSNGYIKPESGDRGSTFFPALEDNIDRVNGHSHNGSDSELLTATSISNVSQSIVSGDWSVAQANGLFRKEMTCPGSRVFDTTTISLRTGGKPLLGDLEKITSNTFYVWVNDNTIDVEVLYI